MTSVYGQISIKNYKQAEEQTFYINTDTSSEKFSAKTLKKPLRVSPEISYTWYKSNQLFTLQGGYDGRILNGGYTSYYKNSSLRSKGTYDNGIKTGLWYAWAPDGKLKETTQWKKGMRNGLTNYYQDGRIVKTERYKNNELNGKSESYELGKKSIIYYKHGTIDNERMKAYTVKEQKTNPAPASKPTVSTAKPDTPKAASQPTHKSVAASKAPPKKAKAPKVKTVYKKQATKKDK
ncbi:MAG: hypothetical protein JST83_10065 [Bacteroidetes bacterium]|nr:hypothetical protein [Bacteroidota bacterium]